MSVNISAPGGTTRYNTIIRNVGAYIASVTSYSKAIVIFISASSSNMTWVKPGYRHGSYSTLNWKTGLPNIVIFTVNVTSGRNVDAGDRGKICMEVKYVFKILLKVTRNIFLYIYIFDGYIQKYKIMKCSAGEGRKRSFRPITWEMEKCYQGGEKYRTKNKKKANWIGHTLCRTGF